jgi:hypothetical protein
MLNGKFSAVDEKEKMILQQLLADVFFVISGQPEFWKLSTVGEQIAFVHESPTKNSLKISVVFPIISEEMKSKDTKQKKVPVLRLTSSLEVQLKVQHGNRICFTTCLPCNTERWSNMLASKLDTIIKVCEHGANLYLTQKAIGQSGKKLAIGCFCSDHDCTKT